MAPPTDSRQPDRGPSSRLAGLAALLRSHGGFADVVSSLEEGHGATIGGTWGSSSALAAAALARELGGERILVVVLPHALDAERFVDDLDLFTDLAVAHLPALESFAVGDEPAVEDPAAAGRLLLVKRLTQPGGDRHGSGGNESHLEVLEDFLKRACRPCAGKLLDECGHPFRNGIENPFDDSPGFDQSVALSINVPVIEVDRRDYKFPGLANRRGFADRGVCHSIS